MEGPYEFPANRLRTLQDPSKTPLVFVACGSFSPVTYLHLRMFEMARDHARFHSTNFEVVGGYLSLVNDAYKKPGLAPAVHRYEMCRLACQETSDWLMVDPWEAREAEYVPTARVLDHFDHSLNKILGGVETSGGEKRQVRIVLLAGSDLIQTMSEPGLWAEEDIHHILGRYGLYIIERSDSEMGPHQLPDSSSLARSPLAKYKDNIYMVPQLIRNDFSSTKVRLFVRRGMSVEYLIPSAVVKYIRQHNLYQDEMGGSALNTPMIRASRSPTLKALPEPRGNEMLSPSYELYSTSRKPHCPPPLLAVSSPSETSSTES